MKACMNFVLVVVLSVLFGDVMGLHSQASSENTPRMVAQGYGDAPQCVCSCACTLPQCPAPPSPWNTAPPTSQPSPQPSFRTQFPTTEPLRIPTAEFSTQSSVFSTQSSFASVEASSPGSTVVQPGGIGGFSGPAAGSGLPLGDLDLGGLNGFSLPILIP
jgi:hypothetical protein